MDRNRTLPCPECGLPNIVERSICKRCRAPLRPETTAPILPRVYTDITGMLYLAEGYLLGIYPHMLTYETDGYFFEVPWDKTRRIQHDRHGQYVLALGYGPHLAAVNHPTTGYLATMQIPLSPFGYPHNDELRRELFRVARHLFTR